MEFQFCLFLFFCFSIDRYEAQALQKYKDAENHFELTYPDTLSPVVLHDNEDIKAQADPFVIEVYVEKAAPVKVNGTASLVAMDAVADDCYKYVRDYTTKEGTAFKLFACTEGAAGHSYYNYIFQMQKDHRYILLKFLNVRCNSCADDTGKPLVYDEKEGMKWMEEIVSSVKTIL